MPDPGWYPDPGGSGDMRWWDGSTWTTSTLGGQGEPGARSAGPARSEEPGARSAGPARSEGGGDRSAGPARTGGGSGLAAGLLGLVLVVASLVVLVPSCADTITGPRVPVPGERTLDLDAGSWTIYQRVPAPIVVGPDRITVDGPRPVDLRTGGMRETVTINEVEYVSRARMEIEVSGRYTVSVSAPGEPSARTSELLITRGLGSFFSQWPWMVALVGGSLALPFGLTRWLRRSRPGHARSLRRSRRRT